MFLPSLYQYFVGIGFLWLNTLHNNINTGNGGVIEYCEQKIEKYNCGIMSCGLIGLVPPYTSREQLGPASIQLTVDHATIELKEMYIFMLRYVCAEGIW